MKPEISVIVPAYNVEKYIARSLNSVVAQTYQNFEVIVIDDASTDKTVKIIEEFCKKNANISLLHQETNQGMGRARNLGNHAAQGKYIYYLDSDDWMESTMLETLYCIAEKRKVDIVACGAKIAYDDGTFAPYHGYSFEAAGGLQAFSLVAEYKIGTIVWNKLYRKSLIIDNKIEFLPIYHEDVLFSMEAAYYCKSYISIKKELYNYFQRKNSITHKKISSINFVGYIEIMKFIDEFFKKNGLDSLAQGVEIKEKLYQSQLNWIVPNVLQFLKDGDEKEKNYVFTTVFHSYFGNGFYFVKGLLEYFQGEVCRQQQDILPVKNKVVCKGTFCDQIRRVLKSPKLMIKFLLPYGIVKLLGKE